jgi:DNA-binding transcriptional regulator YiaG
VQVDSHAAEHTNAVPDDGFSGTPANRPDPEPERTEIPRVPSVTDLRRARKRLGLDLPEVAQHLDVTASTVGKWEREQIDISLTQAQNYRSILRRLRDDEERLLEVLNGVDDR